MRTLILLLACLPVMGQSCGGDCIVLPVHRSLWVASLATYEAANAADLITSLHGVEGNPLLGSGPFGSRQIATKLSLMGAVAVGETLIIRKWPRARRALTWFNFSGAGVTGAVAARNERVK